MLTLLQFMCPAPSFGADVVVSFVAIVESIDEVFCQCISPDSLSVGDSLTGFYTYDSATLDTDPSPREGEYLHTMIPYGIEVHHERYSFGTDTSNVDFRIMIGDSITSGGLRDSYETFSVNNLPDEFIKTPVALISLSLRDNTAMALSGDGLPGTAPDLNDWPDIKRLDIFGTDFVYRITATITWMGSGSPPTGIGSRETPTPLLEQNYPNPFNPGTRIPFALERTAHVYLAIYDVSGKLVQKLVDRRMSPGFYTEEWDGRDATGHEVASGVYFYRLKTEGFSETRKMVLLK